MLVYILTRIVDGFVDLILQLDLLLLASLIRRLKFGQLLKYVLELCICNVAVHRSQSINVSKKVEMQREKLLEAQKRMLIEPAAGSAPGVKEKFTIEAPKPVGLITGGEEKADISKGKEKEKETDEGEKEKALVLKATSVEEATQAVMARRKDTRTAGVDGWKFKVTKRYSPAL